ncbi:histone demethylase (H3-K36 specific), Jmjc domain Epe1 [Schizosaccharomyces osmophilus]|uniref:[histone H3]-dimethyl-L-lysine(36) demethylase n=1 Tax=Schizosaccharomyces osmophilus TaxID=2545709 RepID=A0AAF0AZ59_9SCHI|nr:histone demethylase (H3-K36 specific), Jmjc domain Epe1 [Schizosaccharomyces osmophilus]WBW75094.1 histone demethylase (H3-K36 specific), Jmjc domain Epe1 [Schizosaccharomyces osmophilus]
MDPWFEYDDILNQEFTQAANFPAVSEVEESLASFEPTFQKFDALPPSPEDHASALVHSLQTHSSHLTANPTYVNPSQINPFEYASLISNSECHYPISPNATLSEASTPELSNPQARYLKNKRKKTQLYTKLHPNHYALLSKSFDEDPFPRMSSQDINLEYLRQTGFNDPIIFPSVDTQNTNQLTLSKIAILVGNDCPLHIVDVVTQRQISNKMTMKQWLQYMRQKPSERSRIYDVLSFEVSTTKLALYVRKPDIVRDLDLVNIVWPPSAFASGDCPHVDTYCQMSAENSYIDFHIEFGGSSAYYNILDGHKIFYLIPPSQKHWNAYISWLTASESKRESFLPDMVDKCYHVEVRAKETIIIPSGWIYAVKTPCDTIAISGNFLTSLHIQSQIYINELEVNLGIEREFQFPCFESIMWYTAVHFYFAFPDNGPRDGIDDMLSIYETGSLLEIEKFTSQELQGFEELLNYIYIRAQILRECDFIVDIEQNNVQIQENNGFEVAWAMVPPSLEEVCVDFVKKFGTWFTYHHGRSIYMPFLYRAQETNIRRRDKRKTPQKVTITCHRPTKGQLFSAVVVHTRKSFIEACKLEEERSIKRAKTTVEREDIQKANNDKLVDRFFYPRSSNTDTNILGPSILIFSKKINTSFIKKLLQNNSFTVSLNRQVVRVFRSFTRQKRMLSLRSFLNEFPKISNSCSHKRLKQKPASDTGDYALLSQEHALILHPQIFLKRSSNSLSLTHYFSLEDFYKGHSKKVHNESTLHHQPERTALVLDSSYHNQKACENMDFYMDNKEIYAKKNNFLGFSTLVSSPSSNEDSSFLEDCFDIADAISSPSKQNMSKRKLDEQDTFQGKNQLKPIRTSTRIKSMGDLQMKNSSNSQSAIDSHFYSTKPFKESIKDEKHVTKVENNNKRHFDGRNSNVQSLDDQDQDHIYDFADGPPPKIRLKLS